MTDDLGSFPRVRFAETWSRADLMERPCPAPMGPGIYAWFFSQAPAGIDTTRCYTTEGWMLLYVGISPKAPPTNGRAPSRSTLRQRLRTHFGGNAAGSTLRKTLGCLLAEDLGVALRRVGRGERYTLTNPGEQRLDTWMAEHCRVAWREVADPWRVEREILASGLPLPLNIQDNPCLAHTAIVQAARAEARRAADALPIIGDSGGPRRAP